MFAPVVALLPELPLLRANPVIPNVAIRCHPGLSSMSDVRAACMALRRQNTNDDLLSKRGLNCVVSRGKNHTKAQSLTDERKRHPTRSTAIGPQEPQALGRCTDCIELKCGFAAKRSPDSRGSPRAGYDKSCVNRSDATAFEKCPLLFQLSTPEPWPSTKNLLPLNRDRHNDWC